MTKREPNIGQWAQSDSWSQDIVGGVRQVVAEILKGEPASRPVTININIQINRAEGGGAKVQVKNA